jgi:hypothetical protein
MSTYTPIATQTLASAAASVTFSSIPQGYTDLVLVCTYFKSASNTLGIQVNGDTTTKYSQTTLFGNGTTSYSLRESTSETWYPMDGSSLSTSNPNMYIANFQNYSNTTTYKTMISTGGVASNASGADVALWRSTSAINSITINTRGFGNIDANSTFTLYGIQAGNRLAKADGGTTVTTDGSYWYHTFKSSGAFIPKQALTVDYLVVAGGGGGQNGRAGGGAGGYRTSIGGSALSLTTQNYPVIVGAGGVGGAQQAGTYIAGAKGSNSIFSTITSTGGGGGTNLTGNAGGSGGGGSTTGGAGNEGGYSPVEGYAGGINSGSGSSYGGGGGGGSSQAGYNGSGSSGGAGGNGTANSISGSSVTYAGGGGGSAYNGGGGSVTGGAGGSGGGGAGSTNTSGAGTSGTANTGGGGGSGSTSDTNVSGGGNGGSGIVIIRYAV